MKRLNDLIKNMGHKGLFSKGFTILETVIYLSIFVTLFAAVASALLSIYYSNLHLRANREVVENARQVMEIMAYEIHRANSIYTPTTSQHQLSLETSRHRPEGETFTYIDFFLCETRLCFKKEYADPVFITSDAVEVESLQFIRVYRGERQSVTINLTLIYKNPVQGINQSTTLTSTSSIRKYQ